MTSRSLSTARSVGWPWFILVAFFIFSTPTPQLLLGRLGDLWQGLCQLPKLHIIVSVFCFPLCSSCGFGTPESQQNVLFPATIALKRILLPVKEGLIHVYFECWWLRGVAGEGIAFLYTIRWKMRFSSLYPSITALYLSFESGIGRFSAAFQTVEAK